MATLLVLQHTPSASLSALGDAVLAGAHDDAITGVEVVARSPLEASAEDLLAADGYLLGTAAHFGYMSGALKHLFDSTFLAIGGSLDAAGGAAPGSTKGKPYGLWVHGRYDTAGAIRSVGSIVAALGWAQAAPVLDVLGDVTGEQLEAAYELGATLAALLSD
ncbi:flavodoxin family protein [Nocardioides sp.]|uniref:flavodoxin family protein n=1 Tax=Nocardioides sp. TaxID=35761 RepID=UPI0039E3D884